jgi:hypothetical protein
MPQAMVHEHVEPEVRAVHGKDVQRKALPRPTVRDGRDPVRKIPEGNGRHPRGPTRKSPPTSMPTSTTSQIPT